MADAVPKRLCDLAADKVTLVAKDEKTGEEVRLDLPVKRPVLGPPVIDVGALYGKAGFFTHDPGFTSTSSCTSAITFIDGPKGVLLHRGYKIEDLASNCTFLEVCYLLMNAELPSNVELAKFTSQIYHHMMVHERLKAFVQAFPDGAHPMAVMVGVVGALSAFYHDSALTPSQSDTSAHALAAIRVVAKLPTIAAMAYKHSIGSPANYPRADLSFAGNFLHMMFSTPMHPYVPSPVFERAMDVLLVLHADHEQNASTSTVRVASSSDANPIACIAAGIASLWGPMHGGANEAVIKMLREIKDPSRIPEFLARAKDKNDSFKLMGFGHRVYRNFDPRAKEMKRLAHKCIEECEERELRSLLELAQKLEAAALADDYFVSRKLFPNVDFYSGLALTAIGIPLSMFTVIFAMGRGVGWISQWKESIEEPVRKICRPRQIYNGEEPREFMHRDERLHRLRSFTDLSPTSASHM